MASLKKVLVTGGAGFIGSAVCRLLVQKKGVVVINVDRLTYAATQESVRMLEGDPLYTFEYADICDQGAIARIFAQHRPDAVMHLAAESHVDRSIEGPGEFIRTNIQGTFVMLSEALRYWAGLQSEAKAAFRFHHISTDEVYGSLGETGLFTEETPYAPNSPYAASKASSDHLVRAWHRTYGIPTVISNCSNNYGPYQFPEKLIPLMIINCLEGKSLPIYGRGTNIRDWLFVEDHAEALWHVLCRGMPGEKYNVGGSSERTNIQVVKALCAILDELVPHSPHAPHEKLITYVADRPGHDARYAIDAGKIKVELGVEPSESFESGLRRTVKWYLANHDWWKPIRTGTYMGQRLGLTDY